MKTSFDQTTGKKTWLIDKWYEKTYYVVGVISFWFFAVCFAIGLISGIADL